MRNDSKSRKISLVIFAIFVISGLFPGSVNASSFKYVKTHQFDIDDWGIVAKMGVTTEYFLTSGDELDPRYYSSVIATTEEGSTFFVGTLCIGVYVEDPFGNDIPPDRITDLTAVTAPDTSGSVDPGLLFIYDVLVDKLPLGVKQFMQQRGLSETETDRTSWYAYGKWTPGWFTSDWVQARNLRFGYEVVIDPDYEGTWSIHVMYTAEIYRRTPSGAMMLADYKTLTHTCYYTYDATPTGGGCPILSVFDGQGFADEGLLDIHADEDVTKSFLLQSTPLRMNNKYHLRLTEHPQTYSHLDCVKLYARLDNGKVKELPLTSAIHSSLGNVKDDMKHSDDIRVDVLGADHNGGTSEYIDLQFAAPPGWDIVEYIFWIDGHNAITKY